MSVPASIDYTSILPMAVESRVRRRGYVPSNGASFVLTRIILLRFQYRHLPSSIPNTVSSV